MLFLASIASNIEDPIMSTDNDGIITRWNKAAELLLGWDADEVIGKRGAEILKIDYLGTTRESILESLKQKSYWHGEVIYHAKSGRPVNVLVTASQLKDSEGNVTGNLALVRDITERKITEAKIKQSEILYATLFYESPGMKAISDAATGKYLDINHSFARFLERTKNDIVGKTSLELNMISQAEEREKSMKQIQQFGFVRDMEMSIMSASGKKSWVSINADSIILEGQKCFLTDAVDITKRKEAEEAIKKLNEELEQRVAERTTAFQKSEAQYLDLFSNNPMPMFIMNLETYKFLDVNELALEQYGYSREEFLSLTALDIRPEEDHNRFMQLDVNYLPNRQTYNKGIWRHVKKDGTIILVEIIAHEILFEGIKARLVLTKDVTKEQTMQELLKEHEEQLELFIKYSPVALAMLDKDMIYLAASNRWLSDFGLDGKNLLGQSHYTIFPKIPSYWKEIHRRCLDGAVEKNDEDLFIREDGSSTWLRWEVHPWHKASGEIGGIIIFSEDITARKLAESKLAVNEKRYRMLIENSADGIDLSDEFSNNIYRSPGAVKITGFLSKENQMGLTHPDDLELIRSKQETMIKNPGVPVPFQGRFQHALGHYIWLEGTLTNMLQVEGVHSFGTNFRDVTKRIELEQLLNKANALARIGSWEIDLIKGTVYWSNITREIHETGDDYVPDIPTGIHFYKEGHGRDLIAQKVKEAVELGKSWDVELQIITARKTERWIRSIGETEFVNGKCVRVYGSFQDIDQRKKAEQAITASEEKFRQTFERISDGFVAVDKNWNYTYLNKKAGEITHQDPKLVIGKNLWKQFPDLIGSPFYNAYHQAIEEQKYVYLEEYYPVYDRWFENHIYPSTDGLSVYFTDITERKKADEKIKESEIRYRTIIEQATDAICIADGSQKIIDINPYACELFGYTKEEATQLSVSHLLFKEDIINNPLELAELKAGVVVRSEQRLKRKDGTAVEMEVSTKLMEDGRLIMFGHNITERKLSEDRLNRLNQQLLEQSTELLASNKELEQFAFVASHDLQEPLRMITSYLSLLEKRYGGMFDEKSKKYIDFAVDGARRMRALIQDVLEFSRVGKNEGYKENVDLNKLIQEIKLLLANQMEEKPVSIYCQNLPVIYAQKTALFLVFQNLLSNAIKYAVEGKPAEIDISATSVSDYWQFAVKDNGIGIDPQFFDKIFIIFQRLHNREHYSGTGIGLTITKKIIENWGGKIWVKSEEGKGSTFYFTLKK
jgi:PAS domain S-box-containing protein